MIIKYFDNGWGHQYHWKKTEIQVVNQLLAQCMHDLSRTVVINSVWYTQDFHQEVMTWLRTNSWDRIVLVAMLDAAIPRPDWYHEFDRPVIPVGYYAGPNQIDLFALLVAESIDLSPYGDLLDEADIDTPFICLNRKPHWHRKKLFAQLQQHGLRDHGIVSMGADHDQAVKSVPGGNSSEDLAPNSSAQYHGIPNDIASLGPPQIWRRCFFNVVTETVWDINSTGFVSEKIYKPIVGMRPFVIYDPDGGSQWLRDRGFETYEKDFLDMSDHDPADPDKLILFLLDLTKQSRNYFQNKFEKLIDKIRYNKSRFDTYTQQIKQQIDQGINF
jgi:hypothetical protein